VTADGDVVVPLDAEAFGFWLKAGFGDPTTTGTGPWTHEFQSGSWTLPSMSIETGMPEVPRYAMYSGCVLDQAAAGSGPAADALDRLGLSASDLIALPLDERVGAINAAIEDFVLAAERAAVAGQLFGEEGSIAMSRIDTATLRQATEDVLAFGVVVSEQDADQIERTNGAISRLGLIWRGLANQLAVAAAPALEAAANAMAAVARTTGLCLLCRGEARPAGCRDGRGGSAGLGKLDRRSRRPHDGNLPMKTLSPALQDRLDERTTTLAWVWRITRADSVPFGFTDHDRTLSFDGTDFQPESGLTASEVRSGSDLSVDAQDAEGVLTSDRITETDILDGRWDNAEVEVWRVNWPGCAGGWC